MAAELDLTVVGRVVHLLLADALETRNMALDAAAQQLIAAVAAPELGEVAEQLGLQLSQLQQEEDLLIQQVVKLQCIIKGPQQLGMPDGFDLPAAAPVVPPGAAGAAAVMLPPAAPVTKPVLLEQQKIAVVVNQEDQDQGLTATHTQLQRKRKDGDQQATAHTRQQQVNKASASTLPGAAEDQLRPPQKPSRAPPVASESAQRHDVSGEGAAAPPPAAAASGKGARAPAAAQPRVRQEAAAAASSKPGRQGVAPKPAAKSADAAAAGGHGAPQGSSAFAASKRAATGAAAEQGAAEVLGGTKRRAKVVWQPQPLPPDLQAAALQGLHAQRSLEEVAQSAAKKARVGEAGAAAPAGQAQGPHVAQAGAGPSAQLAAAAGASAQAQQQAAHRAPIFNRDPGTMAMPGVAGPAGGMSMNMSSGQGGMQQDPCMGMGMGMAQAAPPQLPMIPLPLLDLLLSSMPLPVSLEAQAGIMMGMHPCYAIGAACSMFGIPMPPMVANMLSAAGPMMAGPMQPMPGGGHMQGMRGEGQGHMGPPQQLLHQQQLLPGMQQPVPGAPRQVAQGMEEMDMPEGEEDDEDEEEEEGAGPGQGAQAQAQGQQAQQQQQPRQSLLIKPSHPGPLTETQLLTRERVVALAKRAKGWAVVLWYDGTAAAMAAAAKHAKAGSTASPAAGVAKGAQAASTSAETPTPTKGAKASQPAGTPQGGAGGGIGGGRGAEEEEEGAEAGAGAQAMSEAEAAQSCETALLSSSELIGLYDQGQLHAQTLVVGCDLAPHEMPRFLPAAIFRPLAFLLATHAVSGQYTAINAKTLPGKLGGKFVTTPPAWMVPRCLYSHSKGKRSKVEVQGNWSSMRALVMGVPWWSIVEQYDDSGYWRNVIPPRNHSTISMPAEEAWAYVEAQGVQGEMVCMLGTRQPLPRGMWVPTALFMPLQALVHMGVSHRCSYIGLSLEQVQQVNRDNTLVLLPMDPAALRALEENHARKQEVYQQAKLKKRQQQQQQQQQNKQKGRGKQGRQEAHTSGADRLSSAMVRSMLRSKLEKVNGGSEKGKKSKQQQQQPEQSSAHLSLSGALSRLSKK